MGGEAPAAPRDAALADAGPPVDEVRVRPFRSEDRPALRRMSLEVGYMGEPADFYWRHAESFAEIWTAYYTDQEPESLFVAERDGAAVGYLTGCLDSSRARPCWRQLGS